MTEMSLPLASQVWLLPHLLLLMLLLVAVHGVPAKKPQSFSVQSESPSKQAEGDLESGKQRRSVPENSKDVGNIDWEHLAEWTPWSPCFGSCGSGTQHRTRICGYKCASVEYQNCLLEPCPDTEDKDRKNEGPDELEPHKSPTVPDTLPADVQVCDKSLSCKTDLLIQYLNQMVQELPSCPCLYPDPAPDEIMTLHDDRLGRKFDWRDISGPRDFLAVYRPLSRFCIRSLLNEESQTLAVQQCCYNAKGILLTEGEDAAYPELISPDYSPDLDFTQDPLAWKLCKTEWSRYRSTLPTDNGLSCPDHPPFE